MVKSIAIASGKGGVGKTSLAVNCAVKLTGDGKNVALLDADFGMANSHILLNQKIENSVSDILEKGSNIEKVIHETSTGLKLIPGGSGVLELLNLDSQKRWEIIRSLDVLKKDLDILVVDTPAGASDASIEFSAACDAVIVVLVPEPTSFMDAYSFIKALYLEKKFESVSIVVNLAKNEQAAKKSYDSFKKIVTKFLNVNMQFLGWLPESKSIAGSIVARKPAVLQKSLEPILQKNFAEIVNNLVEVEVVKSSGVKFFNNK
jgi:flagellar biosynthesis protein FlhG|tara:strand:+ start:13 stop:795 length:783 start_codon:yes stop_codon:yes gene_type:complete